MPALQDGLARQRSGDLAGAEAIYHAILQQAPDDAMARTLLGLAWCAGTRFEDGLQMIRDAIAIGGTAFSHYSLGQALCGRARMTEAAAAFRASIALQPGVAAAHTALGQALAALGDHAEAAAAFRAALVLDPAAPDAYVGTGRLLQRVGRNHDALVHFRTATELAPMRGDVRLAFGRALLEIGQPDDAAAAAGEAVACDPHNPAAHQLLGDISQRRRDHAAAERCYRRALELAPELPDAHCHLSNALHDQGRFAEAAEAAATAIALRPDYADAHCNRGNALLALLRAEEAETSYRTAIGLQPASPVYRSNLGTALADQVRLDEALAAQRAALAIDPDFVDAQYNHAITLLLAGELEAGFRYYEARWRLPWNPPREFVQPRWHGEALGGRTILLHAEQGLGDMLQMVRYVKLVAGRGGRVVLQVHKPLVRLLGALPEVWLAVPLGAALPPFDVHCPLFSLPRVFGTRLETIPPAPCLQAPSAPGRPFGSRPGLRVGLVWQGAERIGAHVNRERSVALEQLAPLAQIPGVALYGLQKDSDADTQAAAMGIVDLMREVTDFADTAAIVAELDLVISVDTSTAHLAAAMGKPVWLLSRYNGCWRWLTGRSDSPWYPSVRLYRQDRSRDWTPVIARVADDLMSAVAAGQATAGTADRSHRPIAHTGRRLR